MVRNGWVNGGILRLARLGGHYGVSLERWERGRLAPGSAGISPLGARASCPHPGAVGILPASWGRGRPARVIFDYGEARG
jgi:hypothetical protein